MNRTQVSIPPIFPRLFSIIRAMASELLQDKACHFRKLHRVKRHPEIPPIVEIVAMGLLLLSQMAQDLSESVYTHMYR